MEPQGTGRRLAAIMFSDIVGYTALHAESEEQGLRVRERQGEILRPLVESYGGEWVQHVGDETLSSFPSALAAVNCALAIQAALRDEPELRVRIGIHVGDVVREADSLHGDVVNIAARIRPLAEPGGICVSDEVEHAIRSQRNVEATPQGEHELKNVGRPVSIYALGGEAAAPVPVHRASAAARLRTWSGALAALGAVLLVGLAWWARGLLIEPPGASGRPAIAVLPFDSLSDDPEQAFFADGLTDDLTTRLASWRSFPVISRNSSFAVGRHSAGEAADTRRAGAELGARYVVEGSVRRSGDRVRVSVQLFDADTGHQVWGNQFDRDFGDILLLQDEISTAIVGAMHPSILQLEGERAMHQDPDDLDAWSNAQRGWWHFNQQTRQSNAQAQAFFERAIELDPLWGWPHAGLGLARFKAVANDWTDTPEQTVGELLAAAERAVALDDKDAFGHHALGHAYAMSGQTDKMIGAFELGAELNPNDAMAAKCLGAHLALVGRPAEALAQIDRALSVSPRDPLAHTFLVAKALAYFAASQYEEALDWATRSNQQRPNPAAYQLAAASLAHLDRLREARAAVREMLRLRPDLSLDGVRRRLAPASPDFVARMVDGLHKGGFVRERPWPAGGPSKKQPSLRM